MDIRLCTQKETWNGFFFPQSRAQFLQSWEWGEFQESQGKEPVRMQVLDGGEVVAQVQGVVHRLGLGMTYMYLPRIKNYDVRIMNELLRFLKDRKYTFIRVEPLKNFQTTDYTLHTTASRQPRDTLILDIAKTEEELLGAMHAKTRYNIRLAEHKGVRVEEKKDSDVFWNLNKETTTRDDFKSHPRRYYERMLEMSGCYQLIAYYDDKPIASNILITFADTCTYLHGVSANIYRNTMAPYLLQWKGMLLGKEHECTSYDFWGIAPAAKNETSQTAFHHLSWETGHTWTGVTRFKAGFGGERVAYGSAADVVFRELPYKLYQLARRVV